MTNIPPRKICKAARPICLLRFRSQRRMLVTKSEKLQGASMSASPSPSGKATESYDVVVVGAGFAGMYMLHKLRGQGFTARVYEQGDGVGGTWYWNRYPGARCDVESMQYSYSFSDELQQEWDWSERYAPQPEILKYANHVADRFNLRPDIQFNTRVEHCMFDESTNHWSVTTSDGKNVTAQFVVLARGCPTSRGSSASRARSITPATGRMRRSILPACASESSARAPPRSSRCL